MIGFRLRFGNYDFPAGFVPPGQSGGYDIGATALPRRPGSVTQIGRLTPTSLPIHGQFAAASPDDWFATRDAILAACNGDAADLWYGRDEQYYHGVQLTNWVHSDPVADGRLWGYMGGLVLTFTASRYPSPFGNTTHTPALSSTGGTISYTTGTAETLPTWTITIGSGGTGYLILTNAATGETCTIQRPGGAFVAGDVIVLTRDGNTASRNGVITPGLRNRRIPRLIPGSNTITLSVSTGGTATIASLAVSYPDRF